MFDLFEDVKAFTDNLTGSTHDNTTNQRPRTHQSDPLHGEIERTRHHASIRVSPDRWLSYRHLHKVRLIPE
jgi:hypothetical protein